MATAKKQFRPEWPDDSREAQLVADLNTLRAKEEARLDGFRKDLADGPCQAFTFGAASAQRAAFLIDQIDKTLLALETGDTESTATFSSVRSWMFERIMVLGDSNRTTVDLELAALCRIWSVMNWIDRAKLAD